MIAVDVGDTALLDKYALRIVQTYYVAERLILVRQMNVDVVFELGDGIQDVIEAHKARVGILASDAVLEQRAIKLFILASKFFSTDFQINFRVILPLKKIEALSTDVRPSRVGELDA